MSEFDEDLAGAHVAKLEDRDRRESVSRMEAWFAEGEAAEAEANPDATAQGEDGEQPSLAQQITPEEGSGEQWWETAIRNVNIMESFGGALDFADNAFETVRQISAKGDQALMEMGVPAWTSEGFTTDYEKFAKTKNVGDYLPDIGDPEKAGIARSIGKFVAGYALAGRALSGVKQIQTLAQSGRFGQSAVAALKGAMSDFAGMREMEGNLANLVESFPAIANPVTDYLASDEETPELVNKLKTAMVGAGFGMALDGVMAGLRAVRAGRQVQQVTGEMDQLATGLINEAETSRGMIRETLGDPDDARLLIEATEETGDAAAKASARSSVADGAVDVASSIRTPSGEKYPWAMTRDEFHQSADEMLHGTPRDVTSFDAQAADRYGAKGSGRFYFTTDEQVAYTFATRGGKGGAKEFTFDGWLSRHEELDGEGAVEAFKEDLEKLIRNPKYHVEMTDPDTGALKPLLDISSVDDGVTDADIRVWTLPNKPRVLRVPIYGKAVDVTGEEIPDWVPDWVKAYGNKTGLPNFEHEFDKKLTEWMRENGVSKLIVGDTYESGFKSTTALPEYVGLGRDPHREFVEQAVKDGKPVPDSVLADYPELAGQAAKGISEEAASGEAIKQTAETGAEGAAKAAADGATNPKPNAGLRVGNVYVNLARIDSEDDVRTVIQDLANRYSDSIDAGRGPVETFEQTAEAAAREDAWQVLQNRAQGSTLNARQTLAVRQLWTSSGSAVKSMAQRVAAGGSAADQIALKKMISVHATIQEQVIGIRTETARALSQWRIPAGESDQFLGGMGKLMDQMGQEGDVLKIARGINALSAMGREDSVDAFILGASKLDDWKKYGEIGADMVTQLFYTSLLSGPKTHVRNGISNFAMLLANASDRKGSAILGDVLGGQNVPDLEADALIRGNVEGILDAFRITDFAREVAEREGRKPRSPFMNALMTGEQGMGVSKLEQPRVGAFSAKKLGYDPKSNMGRVFDFLDTASQAMSSRLLAASDEVFRTANYQGQIHALAYRKAWQEAESGLIEKSAIGARANNLARTPDVALRMLADEYATKSIFANRPPADSAIFNTMKWASRIPVVGKLAMAFTKTPYNIFIETAQRTPVAVITKPFWTEVRAGGARADIAWTKFLTGNAALISLADMAVAGNVLGGQRGLAGDNRPGETENLRRMGNQPMSIKFEGEDGSVTTVGYRGIEPFSTLIGMAGNIVEILSSDQFDADDKDVEDVITAASAAIAMQVTSPSFMQGLTGMVSFMDDPTRNSESFVERNAGVVVPNALAEVARAMDPTLREVDGMIQAIMAKTPGLSDNLPPNTDRWGTDLTRESGMGTAYDAISPFPVVKTNPAPIDRELERLDLGLAKPGNKQYFDGLPVNMKLHPKEKTRLIKLAGNEMTATVHGEPIRTGAYESEGGGLRDELSAIVEGRHAFSEIYYDGTDGPDGSKAEFIQDIVQAFREEAKFHVVLESPALRAKLAMRYAKKLEGAGDPDLVRPNKFIEFTE